MELPEIPEHAVPFTLGAGVGALMLAAAGFILGGWMTPSTAERLAESRAEAAMVTALTPVCVAQFQKATGAPATLKALKTLNTWERDKYVGKAGWAIMPGSAVTEANSQVVSACAQALNRLEM